MKAAEDLQDSVKSTHWIEKRKARQKKQHREYEAEKKGSLLEVAQQDGSTSIDKRYYEVKKHRQALDQFAAPDETSSAQLNSSASMHVRQTPMAETQRKSESPSANLGASGDCSVRLAAKLIRNFTDGHFGYLQAILVGPFN
jgi:hypothetical protein